MADLRDFTGKNRKFTGTIGERISTGSTGERDTSTFGAGTLRFNTTTALMEYYTGTEWKAIDAPPAITSFEIDGAGIVTTSFIPIGTSSNITIEINGILFDTVGATVVFEGTGGGDVNPITTVRNSSSLITVTVNANLFSNTFKKELVEIYKTVDTDNTGEEVAIEKVSKLFTPAKAPVEPVKPAEPVKPVAKTDETLVEQVKKTDAEIQKDKDIDYIKSFIAQHKLTNIQEVHNLIVKNSAIKNKQLAEPKNLEKFKQYLQKSIDNYNLLN